MNQAITRALAQIEDTHGVEVLYACEAGSRAWGFGSPDSDYDVRFIYRHRLDWYLTLDERRDVIDLTQQTRDGVLDVSGWDLRKALRLFASGNVNLFEWFDSPHVYCERHGLKRTLLELLPDYFNAKRTAHHYLGIARRAAQAEAGAEAVTLKRLLYRLRPIAAASWALTRQQMPPTPFHPNLEALDLSPRLRAEVDQLIVHKRQTREAARVAPSPALSAWTERALESLAAEARAIASPTPGPWEPLNRLFLYLAAGPSVLEAADRTRTPDSGA